MIKIQMEKDLKILMLGSAMNMYPVLSSPPSIKAPIKGVVDGVSHSGCMEIVKVTK